jgi:hypothetical protein
MHMRGRLYSRICGWENGTPVKSYNSDIFDMFPETENAHDNGGMEAKTGSFISNYMDMDATRGLKHTYETAYKMCKLYPSWYFYYGDFKIITAQSL